MESLFAQLKDLPARFLGLPGTVRAALIVGLVAAIALAGGVGVMSRPGSDFQYAFTNLAQEDSAEATGMLKQSNIPYRLDVNGTALAVPADKVYDVRILLATAGIPRGGGVGFELFDRSDLGVSEFTQKVQLKRAIEGELARTIGKLAGVRSARVTVSLSERGLYKDEDKKPSASVVVMLQQGRSLADRELAGIRHLVSSAVPGLDPDKVTVLDGRGAVLSADPTWNAPEASYQRKLEHDYEQRIIGLLEPVVGPGAVIAKVTAALDHSKVNTNSEVFDPDATALRSERKQGQSQSNQTQGPAGVAGAQANLPLVQPAAPTTPVTQGNSNSNDEVKNFEVSKTTTITVATLPRLTRLSVAVVVDGIDGKPRKAEDVARMGELARKAVGFDENRGDQFEITSEAFGKVPELADAKLEGAKLPTWQYGVAAAGLIILLALVFLVARRGKKAQAHGADLVLQPGDKVGDLEARAAAIDGNGQEIKNLPELPKPPVLVDPLAEVRERARAMVRHDPERAVLLMKAWLQQDLEKLHASHQFHSGSHDRADGGGSNHG